MPNGDDKSWVRICLAIDGFRVRYGRWPTYVRVEPHLFNFLRNDLFTPEDWNKINSKIVLLPSGDGMGVAEDEAGRRYSYDEEGAPNAEGIETRAYEWFHTFKNLEQDKMGAEEE